MSCNRCTGMMVLETISTRQGKVEMARCLYCGNLIDPLVIKNRNLSRASLDRMLDKEAIEEGKLPAQKRDFFSPSKPARRLSVA
ncbi:MAG TPA: hypothetical protein VFA47_11410 [Candidatus Manganitrophaceae bacterium]|nr:hypothetical protein [Candidatus Manganitrophaceae bacterium]